MKSVRSRGFTLIELLVVIAIIGLLASIILASLNTARQKGADATAQGNFDNIRTQSTLYYSSQTPNGYTLNGAAVSASAVPGTAALCGTASTVFADPNITAQIASTNNAEGSGSVKCAYTANLAAWVIFTPEITGGFWCVDSTGVEKQEASTVAGTSCP